jgi:hypothetical protein
MLTTQEELLEDLGSSATQKVVERFHRFAYSPPRLIDALAKEALQEEWGLEYFVLEKYLSVHVAWSIEQGRFSQSDNQFYVTAGHLQTRYGTPLYLVFERNTLSTSTRPWFLAMAGSRISMSEAPQPPEIPSPPPVKAGLEVVMSHDHILGEQAERIPFLAQTPPVAQICAVAGAIQWSINRGLQLPYWYFGRMHYLVPLYLQSRENITTTPDLVAPIEVQDASLLVRTVLLPHMPYPNARVAVRRHDQLPPWLLDCWNTEAERIEKSALEDPEAAALDSLQAAVSLPTPH